MHTWKAIVFFIYSSLDQHDQTMYVISMGIYLE